MYNKHFISLKTYQCSNLFVDGKSGDNWMAVRLNSCHEIIPFLANCCMAAQFCRSKAAGPWIGWLALLQKYIHCWRSASVLLVCFPSPESCSGWHRRQVWCRPATLVQIFSLQCFAALYCWSIILEQNCSDMIRILSRNAKLWRHVIFCVSWLGYITNKIKQVVVNINRR